MNVPDDLYYYTNNILKKSKKAFFYILIFLTFGGISSINAQEADLDISSALKPLVLIGDEIFPLNKYCNNRFDFCVAYPDDLFDNRKKPTNNDGRTWISQKGDMSLTVYGTNSLDWSLEEEHSQQKEMLGFGSQEDTRIKTDILSDTHFELAGVVDGLYYYQKTYHDKEKDQFVTLIFRSSRDPIKNHHIKDLRQTITDYFVMQ